MAETLSTISIISFIAAGGFAVLAIALWFIFKIPTVIGDLSGRNAKKSIELMRKNNEKTGNKVYKSSKTNVERGKLTSAMFIKDTDKKEKSEHSYEVETGLLYENMIQKYHSASETGLLEEEDSTALLEEEIKTVPLQEEKVKPDRKASAVKITLLEEIIYVHTKEVI